MKKMGCSQVALIFLAICAVAFTLLYIIVNPMIKNLTEDIVIKDLGKYETTKVHSNSNLNYTCYRQYIFERIDSAKLKSNQYLTKIDPENKEILKDFEADYSSRVEKNGMEGYGFDMSMVDESDYGYIYYENDPATPTEGSRKYTMYNVYFLDSQTKILHKLEYKKDLYK